MQVLGSVSEIFIALIPVLYVLGSILKTTTLIKDKYIPLVLLGIGILISIGLEGLNVESVIQGVLVTGVTVLGNQTVKQLMKDE